MKCLKRCRNAEDESTYEHLYSQAEYDRHTAHTARTAEIFPAIIVTDRELYYNIVMIRDSLTQWSIWTGVAWI